MRTDTYRALVDLGISAHYTGFEYIGESIDLIRACPDNYRRRIVAGLYKDIGDKFNTTPSRVERAIRTAIQCSWKATPSLLRITCFSAMSRSSCYNNPTNSEFLYAVVGYLNNSQS